MRGHFHFSIFSSKHNASAESIMEFRTRSAPTGDSPGFHSLLCPGMTVDKEIAYGLESKITPKNNSICVEQITDLHKTLSAPFVFRWNSQAPSPTARLDKSKDSTFSNPIDRYGWEIPGMDLVDRLDI